MWSWHCLFIVVDGTSVAWERLLIAHPWPLQQQTCGFKEKPIIIFLLCINAHEPGHTCLVSLKYPQHNCQRKLLLPYSSPSFPILSSPKQMVLWGSLTSSTWDPTRPPLWHGEMSCRKPPSIFSQYDFLAVVSIKNLENSIMTISFPCLFFFFFFVTDTSHSPFLHTLGHFLYY